MHDHRVKVIHNMVTNFSAVFPIGIIKQYGSAD